MTGKGDYPFRFEKVEHERIYEARSAKSVSKQTLLAEWESIIDSSGGEPEVQRFLEKYPCILPGLYDCHHGPLWNVVVSQFPLGADHVTDFAFVTRDSAFLQYTFIEIEAPTKPIFNSDGHFSQKFNKAIQQVRDWKVWADKNKTGLLNMYADLLKISAYDNELQCSRFYFVCGRRKAVEKSRLTQERWSGLQASVGEDIKIMTYDRLTDMIKALPTGRITQRYALCAYRECSFVVKGETLA